MSSLEEQETNLHKVNGDNVVETLAFYTYVFDMFGNNLEFLRI